MHASRTRKTAAPKKHLTRFLSPTNSYPRSLAGAPYALQGWPETHELNKPTRESESR